MALPSELEHLLDVPLNFEAILEGPSLRISELLALTEGKVLKTAQPAGETVEVFAAGSLIGYAELAESNGRRAVRMVRFYAGER